MLFRSEIAAGTHPFAATLKAAKRPMLVVGQGALARRDGAAVLAMARRIAEECGMVREDWNGFNVLHTAAARVAGLDLALTPGPGGRDVSGILDGASKGEIDVVYLLGADEIDTSRLGSAFVVYQGHHGDAGAHRADVVLPGAAYTEKSATYVNTEGRVQRTALATFPPGDAKEDWKIVRALSEALGKTLPINDVAEARARMAAVNPAFGALWTAQKAPWGDFGIVGDVDYAAFRSPIANFYMTDPISRASETMAKCVVDILGVSPSNKTGTHD